jgi:peptide/nickel transport system permease protein
MIRYALNRLLLAVPTVALVLVIIFFLIRLVPGDPAQLMLGEVDNPAALARLRAELALDQPLPIQFLAWLKRLAVGDLGVSITQQRPVAEMLLPAFGVTVSIVIPAVALATLIAVPAGMLAAWKQNTRLDAMIMTAATVALSIPSFWLGLLFLLVFGVKLNLLPVVGYVAISESFTEGVKFLVMPVLSLSLIEAGVLVRMVRSSTIDVLRLEYITHARAKGLGEREVMTRHALPNAMAPTWTMVGLTLGSLLGGAVVTETVFTLPGLGRLMVESIFGRDYPVIQGGMLLVSLVFIGVNLFIELTQPLFNPGAKR